MLWRRNRHITGYREIARVRLQTAQKVRATAKGGPRPAIGCVPFDGWGWGPPSDRLTVDAERMQIDGSSLSALSLLARAATAAGAGGVPAIQTARAPAADVRAQSASAEAIGAGRATLTVTGAGLSVLQAPSDVESETPGSDRAARGEEEAGDEARSREGDEAAADRAEEGADGLSEAERQEVRQLQARDAEVRRHEQAHAAAGGQYAGAPSYEYQRGPDGRLYAVGGEVSINASSVPGDPQATIAKLRTVRRAALAPANPSPADLRIAARAQQGISEAQAELRQERLEEQSAEREEAAAAREAEGDGTGVEEPSATEDAAANAADDTGGAAAGGDETAARAIQSRRAFEATGALERASSGPPEIDLGAILGADGNSLARAPFDITA